MNRQRDVLLALGYYDHRFHLGVARYAQTHDWYLAADTAYNRRIPWGWHGDGIIAKIVDGDPLSRFVARARVPVVNVGRGTRKRFPLVLIDERAVAKLAAEHFLTRGFEHFAWVGRHPSTAVKRAKDFPSSDRGGLFQAVLQQAGHGCAVLDWQQARGDGEDTWAAQQAWLKAQMRDLPKPVAIFCWDDSEAAQVILACRNAEVAIPEQAAVLGVNNDDLVCDALPVPLSSIDTDMEGRAYRAAELLDRAMAGKDLPTYTLVPPKCLVTRASTDLLAIRHPGTAKALRFIWDNIQRSPSVGDVAEAAAMSTRGLHKVFVKHLGRTPIQEILRMKLQRAQELLRNTDAKIATIARQSGFVSGRGLYRVFRQHLATTPDHYRSNQRKGR